jgi:hypothetical protein
MQLLAFMICATLLSVRSLLDCYHRNQLPDHIVDTLSTYVGHAKATDTHWYVSATPELVAVAAQRFACFVEGGRR